MKQQITNSNFFKMRAADKRLYLGLFIVGLLFLASYLLETTSLAGVVGLASFTELPGILAVIAEALLLVNLVAYIISELRSKDPSHPF